MGVLKETLHKLEHSLINSGDSDADVKAKEAKERDTAAQAKLDTLQAKGTVGDDKQLSSVPPSTYGIDETNMVHRKPTVELHEAADYTALRPDSQEKADGTGTAGDDLAI